MSAQLRFRTLVKHAGSIYDAAKEIRTDLLVKSLDDIVGKIDPQEVGDWIKVEFDTRRLLKVWLSREQTHAAQILADQLLDSLLEFSGAKPPATVVLDLPGPLPHLEIVEKVVLATSVVPIATLLTHSIEADSLEDEDEDEDEEEEVEAEEEEEAEAEAEEEEEEEAEAEAEEEKSVEAKKPAEAEAEAEAEEVLEPSPEPDAAEEEAEEEEGMEVEKRTIRGRDYWIDINTNKLYAVIDDDDVGDEVGAIVNGRPVFIAA
jgi:hypothetical protein